MTETPIEFEDGPQFATPEEEALVDKFFDRFPPSKKSDIPAPSPERIRKGLRDIRIHGEVGVQIDLLSRGTQTAAETTANLANAHIKLLDRMEIMRKLVNRLEGIAYLDPLTGLPNRRSYDEYMAANSTKPMAIIFIDADHFKEVNKKGYDVGDEGLKKIANAMLDNGESSPMLFRYGGDEFVAAYEGVHDPYVLQTRVEAMRESVNSTSLTTVDGEVVPFSASFVGGNFGGGTVDDVESFKNEMGRTLQANKEMGHRNQSYILGVNNILEPQATPQSEVQ